MSITPDSFISIQRSFPSRVRSPTPAKTEITAVLLGDVVDQFHDENGLADTGAAEQTDLSAPGVRGEEVDNLDPGGKRLDLGGLVHE